ncbi:MAG: hypothetical protein WD000_07080 [Thermodesulfobacteriota bacterium]
MFNFTSQLDDLFLAIYHYLVAHLRDELFTAAVLLVVLLLIVTLHGKLSVWVSKSEWKYKKYSHYRSGR